MSNFTLTYDLIEKVYQALPQQPWLIGMHKQVAQALGLTEYAVSNAISYLIYVGRVHDQVYGFVFDTDGNVVAEGEHFGHSIDEARKMVQERRSMSEKKYGLNSF